jgi:PKD repeat protein
MTHSKQYKSAWLLVYTMLLMLPSYAQPAIGSWTNTGPVNFPINASGQVNGLGRVSQIKFHPTKPNKMYAVSASGGLYISTDNGVTWVHTVGTEVLPQTSCSSVCIDYTNDSVIYLSTGDADYYGTGYGIWKSTNAGYTWAASHATIGTRMAVEILMDSTDHNSIVAATNDGIWKSTDAAVTWSVKKTPGAFTDMRAKPRSKKTLYAATATQFFISNDFGNTWTQITSGITLPTGNTGIRIGVTNADTNVVYLGTTKGNGVIFKSTDGGLNFTTMYNSTTQCLVCYDASPASGSQGNYNFDLNVNPQNANEVWLAAHCIWRSTDGGVTWSKRTNWYAEMHTDMHQVQWNPYNNTQVFDGNDGGVWMTSDTVGTYWKPRCDGVAATEIYHAAQSPISRQVISIGTQDNGELYYNSTWKTNRGGDWGSKCAFDFATASTVYYLTNGKRRSLVPMGSELSYNSPFTATNNSCIEFFPSMVNVAFLGKDSIWRSTDINTTSPTWTRINAGTEAIKDIASCRADSNIVYYVTNNNHLLRSDNALSASPTWTQYTTPAATNVATSLATNKNDANVVFLSCGASIYRSADKGITWTNITGSGLSGLNIRKIVHDNYSTNERLIVNAGSYVHSKNNTTTVWTNYTQNLPTVCNANDLMIYNDGTAASILRLSTYGRGVWECSINNNMTPIVDFSSDKQIICPGDTVHFYKSGYGIITTNAWTFAGGTPSSSSLDSPIVVYPSKGLYTVSYKATGPGGSDTVTKTSYIEVSDGATTPVAEGFEGATFPPSSWQLISNTGSQWVPTTTASGFGTSTKSIIYDNYNINAGGKHDIIIAPKVSLVGVATARLTFDLAYRPWNTSYPDSLMLQLSSDCGHSWTPIYIKTGTALGTTAASTTAGLFKPSATQWRTDTVSLNPYVGNNVMISFENIGYYGQAIYIDNVNIAMSPATKFGASDTAICAGSSITFTDSSANASFWNWTFAGGTPSTAATSAATINYPAPGLYLVKLAASNSVGTTTLTKSNYIRVWALPTVTISASGTILTATGTGTSWQWYKNGILIPGATAMNYTATSIGDYTVKVTDAHGCTATSAIHTVTNTGLSNVIHDAGFSIYPNPSTGIVTIKASNLTAKDITVSCYNSVGALVVRENIKVINGTISNSFNWSELPKGLYEIKINTNDGKQVHSSLLLQ